jgi:hypothetical protein
MPKVSLVICLHKERLLLERLLKQVAGCYDDLVVVHDGREEEDSAALASPPRRDLAIDWATVPADASLPPVFVSHQTPTRPGSLRDYVQRQGGRFYEAPRCLQQEPHWPFAWWAAKHEWILRLDADEFPSEDLKSWIVKFRSLPEPVKETSGYTCIWPLWDGRRMRTHKWPQGRIFLFNRQRVMFFGMVEQVPIPLGHYIPLHLILNHQPRRKSYGLANILIRKQAYYWRSAIATSLLSPVLDLPRWRYSNAQWPLTWEKVRSKPLKEALCHLFYISLDQIKGLWKSERKVSASMVLGSAIHHFLFCLEFWARKMIQSYR